MFPQEEGKEVDTWIVMVVDAICKGIGKEEEAQKHYSLASIILADIYRYLSLCKHEFQFFQGYNILLQWWMSEHQSKNNGNHPQELSKLT